ncbi:Hypothetical protein FKW44_013357 [Caligus rogercresseyi]|uniref:Uncharacterized protein n=1 Tax=Caligus rogercresseyi TaxID=217165 RepID=A0A7T8HL16_CALRO|nr:Hypothetical protein FKW44_013357 [Caligus rogercresseyi]
MCQSLSEMKNFKSSSAWTTISKQVESSLMKNCWKWHETTVQGVLLTRLTKLSLRRYDH